MTRQPIQNIEPVCIECGELAELRSAKEAYPHREDLWDRQLWTCVCGAYVGCHPGTDIPLGYPAGQQTRRARAAAHKAFDPLWRAKAAREGISEGKARRLGYKWLGDQLGLKQAETHISMFDAATARRVIELCPKVRQ